jgi:hypothetical protein
VYVGAAQHVTVQAVSVDVTIEGRRAELQHITDDAVKRAGEHITFYTYVYFRHGHSYW